MKKCFVLAWLVALVSGSLREVYAIPPFARRYATSCQTCHVMIPKLNSTGEAFRLNGYRFAEHDAGLVKEPPTSLGAPAWKEMFPHAMWPSSIAALPPVGFRIISHIQWASNPEAGGAPGKSRTEFEFPHELELLLGGRFDEHIGFLAEVEWKQSGTTDILQAHLVVNDIMAWTRVPAHLLSGRIGIMDPQYLLSYNNTSRVSRSHPLWGNRRLSDWQLVHGDGLKRSTTRFRLQDNQPAIELNGIAARRLYWGAGLATGSGPKASDIDRAKDIYYKLKYKPFGRDLLGKSSGNNDASTGTKTTPSETWIDNGLLLEQFGYFGSWTPNIAHAIKDDFSYIGVAARLTWNSLDVSSGYIRGHHARPWAAIDSTESTNVRTWFVKTEYMVMPWLMVRAVYDNLDAAELHGNARSVTRANFPAAGYNGSLDTRRILIGPIFAPRANITTALEAEIYLQHKGAELVQEEKPNNFWIRLDFAF